MQGLDVVVARNNTPQVTYASVPRLDDYAEQTARQNRGLWCQGCGAISGHYDFCRTIKGGNRG